ncbi:glycerophosphodiester phosphodiesterase [Natrinema ejinorense]|uniref:Glycerophosphodiester phosphodiesterase n=1 Tax=Natrinema ejinorense TaxID=373386 RepID=A0A2A5QUS0_9EURY|nr:glycerophosphodiester phosphodiesterase [Natrinema ejinorense]
MIEHTAAERPSCGTSIPDRTNCVDDRTAPPIRTGERDVAAATGRRRGILIGAAGLTVASGLRLTDGLGEGTDEDRETGEPSRESDPTLIAHRGFAGENPENTIAAVEAAANGDGATARQADLVEIDVVPTADDDVVVFHDDRLSERGGDGLTDANGIVWETDTGTVTSAEVLDSGETVPLLTAVLDAIPASVGVNVELKNPGSSDLRFGEKLSSSELDGQKEIWRPFVERVLEIGDDYENEILLSSFYEAALATSREASTYPIAPLVGDSITDGLEIARTYDAEAIHPPTGMIQGTPFVDASDVADVDVVALAHEEGRDVNVWTVETSEQAHQLAAAGVDGIIADYSDLLDRSSGR